MVWAVSDRLPVRRQEEVTLNKAGGPLGLSIIGGADHSCLPFGRDQHGTFISKVGRRHTPPRQLNCGWAGLTRQTLKRNKAS